MSEEMKKEMEQSGSKDASKNDAKDTGSKKKKKKPYKKQGGQEKGSKFGKNDPAWYFTDPDLLKYVGKIPFSRAIGSEFTPVTAPLQGQSISHNLPGIMAFKYIPGIGIAKTNTDAVNVAARALYSFVRHENSGSRNYEAVDLMLYILAFDSVAQSIAYAQRALNYAGTFSTRNRYLGDALLKAMGFDPDNVRGDILNFQGQLQIAINRINSFCVPGVFPFIKRHFMLPSAVYTDSPSYEESQLYLFRPSGFYRYEQKTSEHGGQLIYDGYVLGNSGLTVTSIMSAINTQINAMMLSEDIGTMSGDIQKAYGKENCYTIGSLTGLINANPVFNENLILQIMNLKAVGSASNADVTQDASTGTLLWDPTFTFENSADPSINEMGPVFSENSLNMPSRELADNPEAIMYATRFTSPIDSISDNTLKLSSCGSEIIESINIYKFKGAPSLGNLQHMSRRSVLSTRGVSGTFFDEEIEFIDAITKFDFAPIIKARNPNDNTMIIRLADLRIYTEVTNETLDNLNHVALFGLFNLPKVAVDKTNPRMGGNSSHHESDSKKTGKQGRK